MGFNGLSIKNSTPPIVIIQKQVIRTFSQNFHEILVSFRNAPRRSKNSENASQRSETAQNGAKTVQNYTKMLQKAAIGMGYRSGMASASATRATFAFI